MDAPTPPRFCAPVQRWFTERFAGATEAQRGGWSAIGRGQDTLIMAPDRLGQDPRRLSRLPRPPQSARLCRTRLEEGSKTLYLSPLKALGNDIERNLQRPAATASAPPPPRWA
jgi:ATP-dependent Lhr-like helicase